MANNNGLADALGSVRVIDLNREELLMVFGYVTYKTKNLVRDRDNYLRPKEKVEKDYLRLKSKVKRIKSCLKENARTQIKGLEKYAGTSLEERIDTQKNHYYSAIDELENFYGFYSKKYDEEINVHVFDKEQAENVFYNYNAVVWLWNHTYDEVNSVINSLDKVPVPKLRDYVDDNLSTILRNSISIFQNKMQTMPTGLEEKVMGWKDFLDNYDAKKAKLEAEEENIKAKIEQIYQEADSLYSIGGIKRFFISSEKISSKAKDLSENQKVEEKKLEDIRWKIRDLDDTRSQITFEWEWKLSNYENFIRLNRSSELWNNQLQEFIQEFNTALNNLDILLQNASNEILTCYEQQKVDKEKINELAKPIQLLEADYPGLKSPSKLNDFIPFSQGVDDKYDAALRIIPEGFRNLVDLNGMIMLLSDYRVENFRDAANLVREEQFHAKVLTNLAYIKVQNSAIISAVKSVTRAINWNGEATRRALGSIQSVLNNIDNNNRVNASTIVSSIDKAKNKVSDSITNSTENITNSITENTQRISENATENTQVIVDSIEKGASHIDDSIARMEATTSIGLDMLADKIIHGKDTKHYRP